MIGILLATGLALSSTSGYINILATSLTGTLYFGGTTSTTICIGSAPHQWQASEWQEWPEEDKERIGAYVYSAGEWIWIDGIGNERVRFITKPKTRKVTAWICTRCWRVRRTP